MRLWTLEAPKPAISAVALSRSRQAWLVGKAGYAAFRLKEGADWSFTDTNVTADLQAVAALGSDSAIAVGAWGTVLRFTGRWERIILDVGSNLNDVHFVDERQGWIVGDDGLILATSDGGTTASWVAETPGLTLHSIYVKTESGPGWAVGEWANGTAAVLHSTRPAEVGGWRLLR